VSGMVMQVAIMVLAVLIALWIARKTGIA